jgi:hypothetical protein
MNICIGFIVLTSLTFVKGQQNQAGAQDEKNVETDVQPSDIGGWRFEDFKPYISALQELEKLNDEYSETVLRHAIDEYSSAIDILEDMESEVEKTRTLFKKKINLNERWYWQEIDRKNQEKRQIGMIKREAKMKSITYFTKAINLLDEVKSNQVRKDKRFINFQIRLFQAYVSTQYDLQNLKPCIPILEKYITLTEKTKNDIWAYKYMASCYGFMETMLRKYKHSSEELVLEFKQKKNRALLTAAELKYGVDSPQFKHLKEVIEIDEKKSERLNDFD